MPKKTHSQLKVVIDGVEYVPVSKINLSAKQIAIELIKMYGGEFDESQWEDFANELQVYISEDMREPTIMETVSVILKSISQTA